jgi:hypothetical protein
MTKKLYTEEEVKKILDKLCDRLEIYFKTHETSAFLLYQWFEQHKK